MSRHMWILGLLLALPAAGQPGDDGASSKFRIEQLNQEIARSQTFSTTPDRLTALLNERATLLVQLMDSAPRELAALALPPGVVAQARRTLGAPVLETYGEWSGTLEAAIADDLEHRRSRTFWYLQTETGKLQLHPGWTVLRPTGSRVTVSGLEIGGHVSVSDVTSHAIGTAATQACTPLGEQKIAVLMLNTPSFTLPSTYNATSLGQLFFGSQSDTKSTASLNGMWKEMSYGRTSATGQVFGPFQLPSDFTCDQSNQITTAAVNAADSTVDFSQFSHVALFFPVPSCSSYAGMDTLGCTTITSPSKGNLSSTVGWFPATPNGSPGVGLMAHELGHSLGLGHSSSDAYSGVPLGPLNTPGTTVEYGDVFSLMGYPYNGAGMSGQYTGEHKSIIKWLTAGEYVEVTASGTYNLRPFESTANPRALRVQRDAVTGAWLWLEFRQPLGDIDPALGGLTGTNVFQGAVVHYEDPALDSTHAYLLDFKPEAPADFTNGALVPGTSWQDPYSLLTLSVSNPTTSGLTVSVSYDAACATLQTSTSVFDAIGGSGTVGVTAPANCSWTASTANSWIHLTGTSSGQGNSVVSFSIDNSSSTTQRTGYITIQRQSVPILQTGSSVSILSVSPSSGTGAGALFSLALRDQAGASDISEVELSFLGAPDCSIFLFNSYLYLGGSTGWMGPIYYNSPGSTLSNTSCTVSTSGAGWIPSGNQLQVTVQVSFVAAFGGTHRIAATAWSRSTSYTNAIPLGTWTVPTTQEPGFTVTATAAGAPFTLDNGSVYQAPTTFYFAAESKHTIQWLSSAPGVTNARYAFQSWSDSSTANPRTFTISSSDATYAATIQAQYLLATTVLPAGAGSVTVSPASADGFYDNGTTVTVTAVPAAGYRFSYFSGDVSGSTNPQQLTMGGPRSVTANFYCSFDFPGRIPFQEGPEAVTGMLVWTKGVGCQTTATSNAAWITLGAPAVSNGFQVIPYSIARNTGASRTGSVAFSGDYAGTMQTTQDAAGLEGPSIVSLSPNTGTASSQVFTLQISDPAGFGDVAGGYFGLGSPDGLYCGISMWLGQNPNFGMTSATGDFQWLTPQSGTVIQSGECILSGAGTSVFGSGNSLTITLGLTFKPAFAGPRVANAYVYRTGQTTIAQPALGTWLVPSVEPHSLTITSTAVGAPFILDESHVYQAPITFYFSPGEQHSVRWLTSLPNTTDSRYTFHGWNDLSTTNLRTFTTPAADTTYTASISAQFKLTLLSSPVQGGTVTATPSSADGFYDSGQQVTLTGLASAGFYFWYFSLDSGGYTAASITMNAAHQVTARFRCQFIVQLWIPSQVGPSPMSGILAGTTGAGCQATAASDSSWLTTGAQSVVGGFSLLPFSITENTGASSRSAVVQFSGDYTSNIQVSQDASGSARTNVISASPGIGNAASQVFTLQISNAAGYAHINSLVFNVGYGEGPECYLTLQLSGSYVSLYDGISSSTGPLHLPGTGVIENTNCLLKGATTSFSGAGNILTVKFDLTFKTAFAGSHLMAGWAYVDNFSGGVVYVPLGVWTVNSGPPVLNVTKTADNATVPAGSPVGFTIAAANSDAPGTGTATNAAINDPLPAGSGLNWSISPAYTGPGICAVNGAVGSQTLVCALGTLARGATASVHVTSPTSPPSCRSYTNTGIVSADNFSPAVTSSANVTVQCPALTISGPPALPSGAVGTVYYATTITATGGTTVYTWSATGLPPGLTIDAATGKISGIPTSLSGSPYHADVAVFDGMTTVHQTFTIPVNISSACDIFHRGSYTLSAVQYILDEAFGVRTPTDDLDHNHVVNVVDIQAVVDAVSGAGCPVM